MAFALAMIATEMAMHLTEKDILATLDRGRELVAALDLTAIQEPAALFFAQVLRTLWPASPVTACLLEDGNQMSGGAVNESGSALDVKLHLADFRSTETLAAALSNQLSKVSKLQLVAEVFACGAGRSLAMAVAVPSGTSNEARTAIQTLLKDLGQQIKMRLWIEALRQDRVALREQLAQESCLANQGELAGQVAHEFNNFLNTLLLQIAILQRDSPAGAHSNLTVIRNQAAAITALIKQLQHARRNHLPHIRPVDLNQLVPAALSDFHSQVEHLGTEDPSRALNPNCLIQWISNPTLPLLQTDGSDLKRAFFFLFKNVTATVRPGTTFTLGCEAKGDRIHCLLQHAEPTEGGESLARLFEAEDALRAGINALEIAVCKKLLQRLGAKLSSVSGNERGSGIIIELPIAQH